MKTIAYTALHYGKPYLAAAIRSVIDSVDRFYVLYTPIGSHGHRSAAQCPDTEAELHAIAHVAAKGKLTWINSTWEHEGKQRDFIHQIAPDADIILVVDSDEVYADGLASKAVQFALEANVRNIRLPFVHMWRSFKRGFPHDPAYPTRVIRPKIGEGDTTMPTDKRVWHYGYAQPSEYVAYKLLIHGHRNEFRRDVDWFNDVFMANRQYDCHPVGSDAWNAEDIDLSQLPSVLQDHPLKDCEVIP